MYSVCLLGEKILGLIWSSSDSYSTGYDRLPIQCEQVWVVNLRRVQEWSCRREYIVPLNVYVVSLFRLVLVKSWDITAEPAMTEPSSAASTDKKVIYALPFYTFIRYSLINKDE